MTIVLCLKLSGNARTRNCSKVASFRTTFFNSKRERLINMKICHLHLVSPSTLPEHVIWNIFSVTELSSCEWKRWDTEWVLMSMGVWSSKRSQLISLVVWWLELPGKVLVWLIGKCICPWGFPGGSSGKKNPTAIIGDIRDTGLILGLGRSPGGGHGNPLWYFCLENPLDRRASRL